MSVAVETTNLIAPEPVAQTMPSVIHVNRDEWVQSAEERLKCNSYGNTNYGKKIGFQTVFAEDYKVVCTFNNDSTGEKVGPFYIYNADNKVVYSGSFGENHAITSLCYYDLLGNYTWNAPDSEAKSKYEYTFLSKYNDYSIQFNVNANSNADDYCLVTENGKPKTILYVDGQRATFWQRVCKWFRSLFGIK